MDSKSFDCFDLERAIETSQLSAESVRQEQQVLQQEQQVLQLQSSS